MIGRGRILLVSPNLKGIKGGMNRIQPGLGIGYLAAVLEREGHEVHVRDTALESRDTEVLLGDGETILIGESDAEIADYISDLNPDIVGISVLFSNLAENAHTVARIAKEVNPRIKVIMGGNHVTNAAIDYRYAIAPSDESSNLEKTLWDAEDPNIDYLMTGECDLEFVTLVNVMLEGRNPEGISGLIFKKAVNGALVVNANPSGMVDLRQLPHPARHLMNMEGYFKIGLFHSVRSHSNRVMNVMASRGCPEKCTFCTMPQMWGSRVRWRAPQDIYEEIKSGIERFNIGEVQFEDDTLTANFPHLIELRSLIEPLGIPWCTPNGIKVNYHLRKQNELFNRMAHAGCYQITLACESGSQHTLDDVIEKNLRLEHVAPTIERAKEAGLLVHTFWIVGFPGETREAMEQTVEFASQSGADSYSLSILTPLPGTPIYRRVMRENLWWDSSRGIKDMMYRNSLIRVDGFDIAEDFEAWADAKNIYLNTLLEKNDPTRAELVSKSRGSRFLHREAAKVHQT